jgi:hypothetical protein
VPTPAPDRRTEGLRALARLIADAVAPAPEAPAPEREALVDADDLPLTPRTQPEAVR